jgi:hypothetical protein
MRKLLMWEDKWKGDGIKGHMFKFLTHILHIGVERHIHLDRCEVGNIHSNTCDVGLNYMMALVSNFLLYGDGVRCCLFWFHHGVLRVHGEHILMEVLLNLHKTFIHCLFIEEVVRKGG